ncbi:SAM-dependent methyltransferase [Mycobacteroides chelonae]|nr:SAM-dependent methyltransferase [Mycobacteroides chelonae]
MPNHPSDLAAAQREHWQDTYQQHPGMYGAEPSEAARHAAQLFKNARAERVLELAAGHGRDALYFAREGFTVIATDFSEVAIEQIQLAAKAQHLEANISEIVHDLREPLPLGSGSVDAVYAHMALCMALSTKEIHDVIDEIWRTLKPGGKLIYTVRHTGDAHYGAGQDCGDDIFEHGGFAVHFFSRQLVDDLAQDWVLDDVEPFDEGDLPRRMWRVTATKPNVQPSSPPDSPAG